MYTDIFIPKDKMREAEQGDVVWFISKIDPKRADSPLVVESD